MYRVSNSAFDFEPKWLYSCSKTEPNGFRTKVKQHDELIAEVIHWTEEARMLRMESSRRVRIMEKVLAVFIPVMTVIGVGSLVGFIYIISKIS